MMRANRLQVGYFAQHQIDELEPGGSVYDHVAERMRGEAVSKIRGRAAMIGFSGARADTKVDSLSGGEKARLMMGLAAFDGPQLLILDEPTNHLDIDSRGELIEAINDYEGACILVSHDRRLLEATRRPAVAGGEWDGQAVRGRSRRLQPVRAGRRRTAATKRASAKSRPAAAAKPKREPQPIKREIAALEDKMNRFQDLLRRVDDALTQASARGGDAAKIAESGGEARRARARFDLQPKRRGSNSRPRSSRYDGTTLRGLAAAVLLLLTTAVASAAEPAPWPDSFVGRLEALALIESLNADLLAHDSATLTIERWCADHRLADPRAHRRRAGERTQTNRQAPRCGPRSTSSRTNRSAIAAFGSSAATMCSPRLTIGTSRRGSRPR